MIPTVPESSQTENFPIVWFFPARYRRPVAEFYAFARAADDIADSPLLSRREKEKKLIDIENIMPLIGHQQARDLLQAFRYDIMEIAISSWCDLIEYCRFSAMPVGRFLLDLFHEDHPEGARASDALCAALQLLNHVRDCGRDWKLLQRCYFPGDWMKEAHAEKNDLGQASISPALRCVVSRILDEVESLLIQATVLPWRISSRSLRAQAAATLSIGRRHLRRLRQADPLETHIIPSSWDWSICIFHGISHALFSGKPVL